MFMHEITSYVDIASIRERFLTKNKLLLNNFLKYLISTYLFQSKKYFHKRWNFSCPILTLFIKLLLLYQF